MLAPRYQAVMVFAQLVCMLDPQLPSSVSFASFEVLSEEAPRQDKLAARVLLRALDTNFARTYCPSLTLRHCRFVWTFVIYLATRHPIRSPLCCDTMRS